MKKLILILISVSFTITLNAQIWCIPCDFPNIEIAVKNVSDHDTIVLSENKYYENVIITKPLTLASEFILSGDYDDIEKTIVDGSNNGTVITIQNISEDTVHIVGITVKGGTGTLADPQNTGVEVPHGGGFFIDAVHAVKFDHCKIIQNNLSGDHNSAGGIFGRNSSIILQYCEISENVVKGGSFFGEGAGLYIYGSTAFADSCNFNNNTSEIAYGKGGAVYAKNSDLTLINSDLTENANIDGGAIYCEETPLIMQNVNVLNNFAMFGSGIYVYNNSPKELDFNNVSIRENSSLSNNGIGALGIVRVNGTILNSVISDNESGYGCGGMSVSYSDLVINNSEFSNNTSSSGIGGDAGGMNVYQSSLILKNSIIDNNRLLEHDIYNSGGGIAVNSSYLELDSVIISNNLAGQGGAIYSNSADININRTLIFGNTGMRGGAIYAYGSTIQMTNSTTANNTASEGSYMYVQHSDMLSVNSIGYNIDDIEIFFRQDNDTSEFNFAYSGIMDPGNSILLSTGTEVNFSEGNIFEDPDFTSVLTNDYSLQNESPMIDAGTAFYDFNGNIVVDIGTDDYFGNAPDIGAIENWEASTFSNFTKPETVNIYPNPAKDEIHIRTFSDTKFNYTIYDLTGRPVLFGESDGSSVPVNMDNIGKGTYIIEICIGTKKINTKIIKI